MRIFKVTASFKKITKRPLVLALGNFDGIHRGHQKLLDYVVSQAKKLHGCAAVFTFQEHPQAILHPEHAPESLQALEQKLALFRARGIEISFLQNFDSRFSMLSAEEFVKKILVKQLGIREICLGYNARFGRGREGDADLLRKLGKECGFKVFQARPVAWRGVPVSSTAVRKAVHAGKMNLAAQLLGRPWSVAGIIKRGSARGEKLGFATANMDLNKYARPAFGVYAVHVLLHNIASAPKAQPAQRRSASGLTQPAFCNGVANFGLRPTFGGTVKPVLETHLFNFKKNIYGKKIEVFFVKRLRNEKKFTSKEELAKQIQKDIRAAKVALK